MIYVLFIGFCVKRQLRLRDIYDSITYSAVISSVLGMLIAAGAIVSWILTHNRVTQKLADFMVSLTADPTMFMIMVAVVLADPRDGDGCDAIMVALAPLLAPIAKLYGVHDVQFGVVFVVCCMIGLITPPVGVILFMTSTVAEVSFEALSRAIVPFVAWCIALVFLIIFVPALTLWIPRYFGF